MSIIVFQENDFFQNITIITTLGIDKNKSKQDYTDSFITPSVLYTLKPPESKTRENDSYRPPE